MNTKYNLVKLEDILTFKYPLYAHTRDNKPTETLQDHIDLCLKYARKLWDDKNMDEQVERFAKALLPMDCKEETERFFYKLIMDCIVFHDTGKLNTEFQNITMNNPIKQKDLSEYLKGTCHSMLSAVLYLDYESGVLRDLLSAGMSLSREEENCLKRLILINAYAISRHHSSLEAFSDFLEEFREDGEITAIINGIYEDEILKALYKGPFCDRMGRVLNMGRKYKKLIEGSSRNKDIDFYIYARFLYALIVTCDYYATSDFDSKTEINFYGSLESGARLKEPFENSVLTRKIREYQENNYNKSKTGQLSMNDLRSEMFLDSEKELMKEIDQRIFFLEAPTGCGKSNTAFNLSVHFLENGSQKIYYVYPYNTLVAQNIEAAKKSFGDNIDQDLAVINAITPIKARGTYSEDSKQYYQEALLNRQFLNYPIIITTHVSLFDTMFGSSKEALFGFLQLENSVIVLDEIQSYENKIWAEIIIFLKAFARLLNMKILIMSATLPNLELLTGEPESAVHLIKNRDKYFLNPIFKNRVINNYDLLDTELTLETLCKYIKDCGEEANKILVEFIKKDTAKACFQQLKQDIVDRDVELLTGEDNSADRKRIIDKVKNNDKIILIATQTIEAGIDIDMDLGFKNISKLDSEEQFAGRINRSCLRKGRVFYFKLDEAKKIYRDDIRVLNKELTLENTEVRKLLEEKDFATYYNQVLSVLIKNRNQNSGDEGLEAFFENKVRYLNFPEVDERMKLIKSENWKQTIFLSRKVTLENGEILDGEDVWETYKNLLRNQKMDYAEKKFKLAAIRSRMDYFTYQINKNIDIQYADQIGELLYIDNGDRFFENGKLNVEKFQNEIGLFTE